MAGYKSYDNVDPNEIFKLVNAYTGQMYPSERPTDLTDAIQKNQAQEEQYRQGQFQQKIAEALPSATDEKSVADIILNASKETGQAEQFLKTSKLKDQYEFEDTMKQIGSETNSSPDDIRTKAGAAFLNHGDIEKYLSLAKTNSVKTQFRNGMVYKVNPDGTYTAEKDPFAAPKKQSSKNEDVASIEYILESDPTDEEVDVSVQKSGSKKALEARAEGKPVFSTQAELDAYRQNKKLLDAQQTETPKPGMFASLAGSLFGKPSATPTPAPVASQGTGQRPKTASEAIAMGYRKTPQGWVK